MSAQEERFLRLLADGEDILRQVVRRGRRMAPPGCDPQAFEEEALGRATAKLWDASRAGATPRGPGWFATIALSAVLDQYRRERGWHLRRDAAPLDETIALVRASVGHDPERILLEAETAGDVRSALARIAADGSRGRSVAVALELRYGLDAEIAAIARQLAVSERTVHRLLAEGISRLRDAVPVRSAPVGASWFIRARAS